MDLTERLLDSIDGLGLKTPAVQNINNDNESMALASLPGGTVIQEYYDGVKDKGLNYELRGKTKDPDTVEDELNTISSHLSDLNEGVKDLVSENGSFEFIGIDVSDEPFFLDADNSGYFFFSLTFTVKVTIF